MANNIAAFETEFFNLLASTANLDAASKTLLRDSFVAAYPDAWQVFLAAGNTDTAANRGPFVVNVVVRQMRNVVRENSVRTQIATLPPPTTID